MKKLAVLVLMVLFFTSFVIASSQPRLDYRTELFTEEGVSAISPDGTVDKSARLVLRVHITNLSNEPIEIDSFWGRIMYYYNWEKQGFQDIADAKDIYLTTGRTYSFDVPLEQYEKHTPGKRIGSWKIQLECNTLTQYGAEKQANPIDFTISKEDKIAEGKFDWNKTLGYFVYAATVLYPIQLTVAIIGGILLILWKKK